MTLSCIRCQSDKIIPDIAIRDSFGDTGTLYHEAAVHIHGEPQAWFFKETAIGQLRADICGECGHVALRIDNFRELYESYLKSGPQSP